MVTQKQYTMTVTIGGLTTAPSEWQLQHTMPDDFADVARNWGLVEVDDPKTLPVTIKIEQLKAKD